MKKTIRILSVAALLLCAMLLTGCVAGNASAWREYKVFCGMSSKNGEVSEDAWKRFCDKHVSEAFPDGYTVLDATGYWRSGQNATAKERSKVILVIAPADAREKMLSVARQFQKEFSQEFVLISSSDAEMEVVSAKDTGGR
jgi:ABC-type molybdate transport system substrate-binding protein